LESARGMVGPDSPLLPAVDRQLLLATADQLAPAVRDAQAAAVHSAVTTLEDSVSGPVTFTLTLTARKGTIPLTLHNDSGVPLSVVIHLRSAKLDFPDGTDVAKTLEEPVTRFDIPVRSRASGAFPLTITVTTPDGGQQLVMSRYTVRSTAVAGAGLVLGIGAGVFLLVWWARHWHNTRRNARLV